MVHLRDQQEAERKTSYLILIILRKFNIHNHFIIEQNKNNELNLIPKVKMITTVFSSHLICCINAFLNYSLHLKLYFGLVLWAQNADLKTGKRSLFLFVPFHVFLCMFSTHNQW